MSTIPTNSASELSSKVVLVMLSTGKQGASVVRALAQVNESAPSDVTPWTILAQTRDPESSKSKALGLLKGVHLVKGTADEPEALFASAPGPVYGVFSVQLGIDNPKGIAGEISQAKLIADASAKHSVKHFIYSSANFGGVPGNKTDVPHFESKRLGEEYLKDKYPALPKTILRPVTFMDQLVQGDPTSATSRLTKIMFLCQLKPTTRLQFLASSDIGGVAALAFQSPEQYVGQVVDVAGDELCPKDLEDGWREVALSWAIRTATKELRLLFKAILQRSRVQRDIPALRKQYPHLKDWKTFLRTEVKSRAP
ncbi:nucleoside-diphosphate-sugar epimerase family protein [Mycena sp. CBHHK59/15]|nr:nucleoside-diphosphate-sugar epimerase family protein [Mycena sp. CBHHK59/15]